MYQRKIILAAAAVLAIGIAFAAQSTSDRSDRTTERAQQVAPWVPGTNMLMSAHEPSNGPLAPPR